jgi:hypothetical protein
MSWDTRTIPPENWLMALAKLSILSMSDREGMGREEGRGEGKDRKG